MLDELPKARRIAILLILRIGEVFLALLAIVLLVYLVRQGADVLRSWGVWSSIVNVGIAVFILWLLCFLELELDSRIFQHEFELIPSVLLRLLFLSFVTVIITFFAGSLMEHAHVHVFDYAILDACAVLFVDVIGVCVTIRLFLAQRRLNRAAPTPHD